MRKELQDKLFKKYKFLEKSAEAGTMFSACGIECGDGWFDLIDHLFAEMEEISLEILITQMKSKFASLDLNFNCGTDLEKFISLSVIVDEYTEKSKWICENCGKPGSLRSIRGWLKTLCDKDYRKEEDEMNTMFPLEDRIFPKPKKEKIE